MIVSNHAMIMSTKKDSPHPVVSQRNARGWSQAEMAERAGLPRTTLSAIESRRLTPSVTAALAVAKALDMTVESLFSPAPDSVEWAFAPEGESVRYRSARVGDRILAYPVESLAANPFPHDGVWRRDAAGSVAFSAEASETLVLACCDPASGLLAHALAREAGVRLLVLERGGLAALDLLRRGLVHLAGLHFSTEEDPDRNRELVHRELGSGHSLVRVASWEEGIALPFAERHRRLTSFANRGTAWALREPGSAARDCLDGFLGGKKNPVGRLVSGHAAVASSVRSGWAEAGVCVRLSAEEAGLAFVPLRQEALDFCVPDALLSDPRVKALLRILRSREHRRLLDELPGYDASETGTLLSA